MRTAFPYWYNSRVEPPCSYPLIHTPQRQILRIKDDAANSKLVFRALMASRCDSKFSSFLGYSSQSLLFNPFNVGADVLTLCETAKTIATVQDTVYPCCQSGLGLHFSCPFLPLRKNRLEGNMGKNKSQTIISFCSHPDRMTSFRAVPHQFICITTSRKTRREYVCCSFCLTKFAAYLHAVLSSFVYH
jgi:hypothetical protein